MNVDRQSAPLASAHPMCGADHEIAQPDVFLDIGAQLVECSHPETPRVRDRISSLDRPRLVGGVGKVDQLCILGEHLEAKLDFAGIECGEGALGDFDVVGRRDAQILFRSSSFLPITIRWISEVPSPISNSGASR